MQESVKPKLGFGNLNYNKMKHKHISFPEYKATATVDEDCPQNVIDALKEMCRIAYYNLKVEPAKDLPVEKDTDYTAGNLLAYKMYKGKPHG
jgi:hypothetical protein